MRFTSRILAVFVIVALMLGTAALLVIWQLDQTLTRYNIHQFDYRVERLSLRNLQLNQLSFVYDADGTRQQVSLDDVSLKWRWSGFLKPQLTSLDIAQLDWHYLPGEVTETDAQEASLPASWQMPAIIPQHINVDHLIVTLPCPSGRCSFSGPVTAYANDAPMNVKMSLSPAAVFNAKEAMEIAATYAVVEQLPQLDVKIAADEQLNIELRTALQSADELRWHGALTGQVYYPPHWIRQSFAQWNIHLDKQWAERVSEPLMIDVQWDLAVFPLLEFDAARWEDAVQGRIKLDMDLPSPVQLLEYGKIAGEFSLALDADESQVKNYSFSADISATEIAVPPALKSMGVSVDSLELTASSTQQSDVDLQQLPLSFSVGTGGQLTSAIAGKLVLDPQNKILTFDSLTINASMATLVPREDWVLEKISLQLLLSGELKKDHLHLQLSPSKMSAGISSPIVSAIPVQLAVEELIVDGDIANGSVQWESVSGTSTASISAQQLQHAQLHPLPWAWQGTLKGSAADYLLDGDLLINEALNIHHTVKGTAQQLKASWHFKDVFLLAGNPFEALLKAWPELLILQGGKVKASGDFSYDLEDLSTPIASHTTIGISEVNGIYDTTAFRGLTTSLQIETRGAVLEAGTDEVQLGQVNKGFVMGPFLASVKYESTLNKLTDGKLLLKHFSGEVMGGKVSTAPQTFDLSADKQALILELDSIDLGLLLQQHPSTELSGSGAISGTIPIEITATGISVPQGAVAAQPPGGRLQFSSERAEAIARSQPSMKLITEALEDFHYSVLASEVSYDESGKLLLSLRLQGRNPALENGRPVHFNINLEENLPAMIASLQLSSQISDVVKKRLQERIQRRSDNTGQ